MIGKILSSETENSVFNNIINIGLGRDLITSKLIKILDFVKEETKGQPQLPEDKRIISYISAKSNYSNDLTNLCFSPKPEPMKELVDEKPITNPNLRIIDLEKPEIIDLNNDQDNSDRVNNTTDLPLSQQSKVLNHNSGKLKLFGSLSGRSNGSFSNNGSLANFFSGKNKNKGKKDANSLSQLVFSDKNLLVNLFVVALPDFK